MLKLLYPSRLGQGTAVAIRRSLLFYFTPPLRAFLRLNYTAVETLKVRRVKIQRRLALIAFLRRLTGPQIRLDSFPCCGTCGSCHGLTGSYSE